MRATRLAFIALIMVAGFIQVKAHAASLRCGVRLITIGDYKDRVLAECGGPDHIQVWEEERVYGFSHHPQYYGMYENYEYLHPDNRHGKPPYRIRKLVIVEEWTYNHGPSRFMDHVILENGIVRSIKSGDYGY